MGRHALMLIACVALCLHAAAAQADVVTPYEGECPPGLQHYTEHEGSGCTPRVCTRDSECGPGAACRRLSVCIAQRVRFSQGMPDGTRDVRVALCGPNDSCPDGAACRHIQQCEPTAPHPDWSREHRRWTGGRRAPGNTRKGSLALAGVALLLVVGGTAAFRRRRG